MIYAHYYYPDVASTGQILTELAEGLRDNFHTTVICTVPSYTGKISQDELAELSEQNPAYTSNDNVGKSGIEQVMELDLQGIKGSETIYVNNMGKVMATTDVVEPKSGNHVYLSLDKNLQVAVYNIIEQKLAGIIVSKMRNVIYYDPSSESDSSDIIIPISDVYFALINNSIININEFDDSDAQPNESAIYDAFIKKQEQIFNFLSNQLYEKFTPSRLFRRVR